MNMSPLNRKRSGFVTIYVVFTSLVLIPVVGLAIDFSVLYNVKARLQTAVDAGCIAAGYTLQRSTDITSPANITAIEATAQSFFNANYPSGYWGSTQASYTPVVAPGPNSTRTISLTASENVPLLFLRVLGLSQSTVAATAQVSVRFLTMMVVVDRSGSVGRGGNIPVVQSALDQFIGTQGTSPFVDNRDVIGLGSFGTTWNADLPPSTSFRTGTPSFTTAVANIPFGNNATNTAEGLYQAYVQLQTLNQTGALNVIVLLTDGRPSAFTATFNVQGSCTVKGNKTGVVTALVSQDSSWPPPQTQGGAQGTGGNIYNLGLFRRDYSTLSGGPFSNSDIQYITSTTGGDSSNCNYLSNPENIQQDISTFPATDLYSNSLISVTSYYPGADGQNMTDPRAVRYASFNAADNQAKVIRQDTTLRPVLFVIGLNEPASAGEPLDADFLARLANDPNYRDSLGNPVFQSGQTPGMYYNVTGSGLAAAFQDIASQILRLSQ